MATKILIAEDDDLNRQNISAFLIQEGYEVKQTTNGAQALRLAERERFDLVISDVFMPLIGGFELVEGLKSVSPYTPVLLMTGHAEFHNLPIPVEIMFKPIHLNDLLFRIWQLLSPVSSTLLQ
ncbi:MAG: response regulator transcription factor [Candidatus Binatia bacterium]